MIEHFHGVKFNPPLTRMKEYIEIINTLMRNEPLKYNGKVFNLQRGFTLRFAPARNHIPIYLATLNAKSVKMTAELADGWLPVMIPLPKLRSCKIISWSSCRLPEEARLNRIVPVREDTMSSHAETGDVFF